MRANENCSVTTEFGVVLNGVRYIKPTPMELLKAWKLMKCECAMNRRNIIGVFKKAINLCCY